MIAAKLTSPAGPAHKAHMELVKRALAGMVLAAGAAVLPGCISVQAPDKPIVIQLDINITQEVVYRLANDVKANIQDNPEIF